MRKVEKEDCKGLQKYLTKNSTLPEMSKGGNHSSVMGKKKSEKQERKRTRVDP